MNFVTSFRQFSRCSNSSAEAKSDEKRARQRGWALISVLWTTAMLGMMAAATQDLTVTSVRTERRALARAHLENDLDAGVARAILALDDSRTGERWRVGRYFWNQLGLRPTTTGRMCQAIRNIGGDG